SSDNHIRNNNASSNRFGIFLYASEGNNIMGNNASYVLRKWNWHSVGVQLVESHGNNIEDNDLMGNLYGINLDRSNGNDVADNNPWNNDIGVFLEGSSWNNFTENDFLHNDIGIRLGYYTENNTLYHNYFVLNYENAEDFSEYIREDWVIVPTGRKNIWDNGYPSGGNFWDDYAGRDMYHGPNQDSLGSDGIGDTPHSIYKIWEGYPVPNKFEDRFPLTQLWATVQPVEKPPVAMAGGPYAGYEGSPVFFDASGSHDPNGDRLEYRWDLDNDGEWDDGWSSSPIKPHTWEDDYAGTILVEVSDGSATSTDTSSVTIINVAPTVSVGDDRTINEGDPMFFGAAVSDPGMDELTYEWSFGDGHKSAEISPTHTYEDDGVYTATLTVTDNDNGMGSDSLTVTVQNVNPTVSLGPDSLTVTEGETIPLYAFAMDVCPADVLSYEWDLDGDGVFDDGTEQSVEWTAGDDGVYTVSVRVTDDDGGQETDSTDIIVSNVPPIVDATVTSNRVNEGELAYFFGDQTDPGPDTFTYFWEFGDGHTSTEQNPTHTYTDPGTFTVTLTVTDDDLGEGSDTIHMMVESIPPVATATVDQNPVGEGVEVHFSGEATGSGTDTYTFYWNFDDGGTSTEQNPSYTYLEDGVYVATLKVTDDDGDTDTTWIVMHIDDREPTADAGPDKSVTIIDEVTFDGSGSSSYPDAIVSYEWDFDDGETASGETVKHTFGEIGTYTVTLTVTDDDGSVDIDTAVVKVLAPGVELIVGEIEFTPPSPLDVGVDVTISSDITNYGNTDASNVIVRFYDGDPDENDDGKPDNDAEQIGDDITFTSIVSEETVEVSVTWTSTLGYHDIYLWADPDDYIPEYDDTNNQAFDMIVVG
ncbi:MAG: PKD domain-containing protein, partial [Thermoplasmata archaeon]|nr:PKD domain-containing protein [Thermoplasmata archaeon]